MLSLIGNYISRLALFCLAACAVFILESCSISDRIAYEDNEGAVPEQFFKQIRRDRSEKSWVVANLGDPYRIQQRLPGQEIYTYRMTRSQYRNGQFLLLLHYGKMDEEVRYLHIALQDDIVKSHWFDSLVHVQTYPGAIAGYRELAPPATPIPMPAPVVREPARVYYSDQNRDNVGSANSPQQAGATKIQPMGAGQVATVEPKKSRLKTALDAIRKTFQSRAKAKKMQKERKTAEKPVIRSAPSARASMAVDPKPVDSEPMGSPPTQSPGSESADMQ
ncbi:MAG: hypothetical protein COA42_00270 [Alteromonadaceae bacterium]|nr:MAG: hypothetical protein COA42_00270 [Alteromonadaceae bacterium]